MGESGLVTPDDIAYVQEAGVKAVSLLKLLVALLQIWDMNCYFNVLLEALSSCAGFCLLIYHSRMWFIYAKNG